MKWTNVIEESVDITVDELKKLIENQSAKDFVLIDVRQPSEYAKSHIPGALSMPLNDLVSGDLMLPERKPLVVYSRRESRSQAAIQWFATQGFSDVKRLKGGFDAWSGTRAHGQYDLNLNLIKEDIEFQDALSMAYAMEEGIRQFYLEVARETTDENYRKLYRRLASFEVEHKQALANTYSIGDGKDLIEHEIRDKNGQILEGGGYADESLIKTLAGTDSVYDVFSLAIAFETQAYDFYVRLASKTLDPKTKEFYLEMADAEKEHLAFVTKELDKYLNQ